MEATIRNFDCRDIVSDWIHLRALYGQAPDAILVLEPGSGVVLGGNEAVPGILGHEADALLGHSIRTLAHPDARERDSSVWKAIANGSPLSDADIELIGRDGHKIEASVSASAARDEQGEVLSTITVWRDVSRRKCAERERLTDQNQLRILAYELSVAEERERKRIASGLHDEIGQVLAITKLKLGELGRLRQGTSDFDVIEDVRSLVDAASRAARTATFELSCPVLQQLGLEAAIENLGSRMRRLNQLEFHFSSDGEDPPYPAETLAILYRVARELLFNVCKHARACNVWVDMHCAAEGLIIRIQDDGVGFEPGDTPARFSPSGGFGLFSISAQMRGIDGRMAIVSAPGSGTRVELRVPRTVAAAT